MGPTSHADGTWAEAWQAGWEPLTSHRGSPIGCHSVEMSLWYLHLRHLARARFSGSGVEFLL